MHQIYLKDRFMEKKTWQHVVEREQSIKRTLEVFFYICSNIFAPTSKHEKIGTTFLTKFPKITPAERLVHSTKNWEKLAQNVSFYLFIN